jgi:hypothetical protein
MVTAGKREWNRNLKRSSVLHGGKRARPLQPTIGVREVAAPGCVELKRMKRQATVAGVIGAGLIYAMTASADPYNPGERALGGGLLGAGTGAVIGAIAGGGRGAGTGAAVGGGLGAVAGAATTAGTTAGVIPSALSLRPSWVLS